MVKRYRIVNIRFELDGLHFDAAVDCDWQMHAYRAFMHDFDSSVKNKESKTPIEVYCFDHPEWDVLMVYQDKDDVNSNDPVNQQQESVDKYRFDTTIHTSCDFDKIIQETKKWIERNKD
jgi:hypothetical protein